MYLDHGQAISGNKRVAEFFCDSYVCLFSADLLQDELTKDEDYVRDIVYLCLAGLKQARYIVCCFRISFLFLQKPSLILVSSTLTIKLWFFSLTVWDIEVKQMILSVKRAFKGTQSSYFVSFWPDTKLPLN